MLNILIMKNEKGVLMGGQKVSDLVSLLMNKRFNSITISGDTEAKVLYDMKIIHNEKDEQIIIKGITIDEYDEERQDKSIIDLSKLIAFSSDDFDEWLTINLDFADFTTVCMDLE